MARRKVKSARPKRAVRSRRPHPRATGKLPKGAVTQIVLLRPREGQELLLEAELRALVGPTRKEADCLTCDLHRSVEPPPAFLLHEVWASRDAHTQHTRTPHFMRWNARKDSLVASRESAFWQQIA
jgi:quinol monooxygenase YgiN